MHHPASIDHPGECSCSTSTAWPPARARPNAAAAGRKKMKFGLDIPPMILKRPLPGARQPSGRRGAPTSSVRPPGSTPAPLFGPPILPAPRLPSAAKKIKFNA